MFLLPGLSGVALFYLIPFADVVRRSFCHSATGDFCGLENYTDIFSNVAFRLALRNTLRFMVVCIPLLLLLSLLLSLTLMELWGRLEKSDLSRRFAEETIAAVFAGIKGAYLIPLAIPAASVVLLWKLLFDDRGFINGVFSLLGIADVDWMDTGAAFGVLVFSYIWKNIGYSMVLWMAALASVPPGVREAAQMDGAGRGKIFFHITIPMIRPTVFTIITVSLLNSFKVFREAYLVAGNYPQEDIYLLQHLFNNWFLDLSVDKMAAGAVILTAVITVFVALMQKFWETNEESG